MSEILNCLKKIQLIISGFQNAVLHHKERHQDGGADEINVAGLSGELADQQKPKAHTLASHSTKAHSELTGVTASQHHTPGITFNLGLATVGTKQAQALIPGSFTISKVIAYADTAPTGASIKIDIKINGSSLWDDTDRLIIFAGAHSGSNSDLDHTALAEGNRITIDVDQVGSTTPGGSDLLVTIIC